MSKIISQLKEANLLGRGGAAFPVWQKWEAVKNAVGDKKYIICNGAEGEPDVFKDEYIIKNYSDDLINGIKIAIDEMAAEKAYLYLNHDYYKNYKGLLSDAIKDLPIGIIEKGKGYIAGEESAACEFIETGITEPRQKPPFLSQVGLWGMPTLVNNIESFYFVSKISKGEYKNTKFFSVTGDVPNKGVYEEPESSTVEEILKKSGNYPDFDFFIQLGGGAEGVIMLPAELNVPFNGCGSIKVFNRKTTDLFALMEYWAEFLIYGNCDKCVPCREGSYRIYEMVKNRNIDKEKLFDLLDVLEKTSFCALGKGIAIPFRSLILKLNFENYGKEKN